MNRLSAEQILDIIKKNYYEHEFAHGDWCEANTITLDEIKDLKWEDKDSYVLKKLGLGKVELEAKKGGEDQGSVWYRVWNFVDHEVLIRIDGHYQSYHGVEFYKGYGKEVKPVTKSVVFYE